MELLVRSWNLFHGNTKPTQRRAFLEEMVRLASADAPAVLCLQEVPAWGLAHLAQWSGMQALGEVAQRPAFGPLPSNAALGRAVTSLNCGLFRSAVAGQANAILLSPKTRILARHVLVLNSPRFREQQARWLGLGLLPRLAWAKERRICQAVKVELTDGRTAVYSNLHATAYPADERLADAELLRAAVFADGLAQGADLCVFAGDLNVTGARSRTLADLPAWGFSSASPERIDQVLVRGARAEEPKRWPDERRRTSSGLLSDHGPIDLLVE